MAITLIARDSQFSRCRRQCCNPCRLCLRGLSILLPATPLHSAIQPPILLLTFFLMLSRDSEAFHSDAFPQTAAVASSDRCLSGTTGRLDSATDPGGHGGDRC